MVAGRYISWYRWEMRVAGTWAITRSGAGVAGHHVGGSATVGTGSAPNQISEIDGIRIEIWSGSDIGAYATLAIPALFATPKSHTISASAVASANSHVEVDDPKVYCLIDSITGLPFWRVKFSELRWYVDGTLRYTHAASTIDGSWFSPTGMPLFGIPAILGASAYTNPNPSTTTPVRVTVTTGNFATNCDVTADGGWRFKEDSGGAYQTPLVTPATLASPPALTCACSSTLATASATNTYNGACTAKAQLDQTTVGPTELLCCECTNGAALVCADYDIWTTTVVWDRRSSTVMLLPDLAKRIKRWNSDYNSVILRWGMPWTKKSATTQCQEDDDPATSAQTVDEVLPSQSQILFVPGSSVHAGEDTMGYSTFAPISKNGSYFTSIGIGATLVTPGACPLSPPEDPPGTIVDCTLDGELLCTNSKAAVYPHDVETRATNADMLDYFHHTSHWSRLLNYHCNPHWHFFLWFPPPEGEDGMQSQWPVGGADVETDYWIQLRTQYTYQSSLPGGEQTRLRVHNPSAPLYESPFSGFVEVAFMGAQTCWWGVSRFIAEALAPAASKTLDSSSSSAWTFTNCSAVFGAKITITPDSGHTTLYATKDLGRFNLHPWQYEHIAKRITIGWDLPNVVSVDAYLVSVTGQEVLIGSTQATHNLPLTATDTKYAGSWAHDFGNGMIIDQGADSLASGISAATIADPERVASFNLIRGQQGASLKFKIVVSSDASPMDLHYPVWLLSPDSASMYLENGHHTAIIWPDGPGIRFGTHIWWDYVAGAIMDAPEASHPGYPPTGWKSEIVDYLAFKREYYQGLDESDGLDAEVATHFDSVEGNNAAAAATYTLAFLVPGGTAGRGVMMNLYREAPPLAIFPLRARNTTTYEIDAAGAFVQETWDFSQKTRRHVSAKEYLHVFDPRDGTQWTANAASSPLSWFVSEHTHAVQNDEPAFHLKAGAVKIAELRPWNGTFSIPRLPADGGAGAYISSDVGLDNTHYVAWINGDGNVEATVLDHALNELYSTDLGFVATWLHIKVDKTSKDQRLRLYTIESGAVKVRRSTDGGKTFSAATTIAASGAYVTAEIALDGTELVYWVDGAAIKGRRYDRGLNALEAEFTAVASGVDASTAIAATHRDVAGNKWRVVLWYISGGARTFKTSADGKTFV